MRALLFVVAFAIGIVLTAPLDRWLLPMLREPLRQAGLELHVGGLHFSLPAGIRADTLGVGNADVALDLQSLYVGLTRSFVADACGGQIRGHVGTNAAIVELLSIDPSLCLRVGKLALETSLNGSITVDGIDLFRAVDLELVSARIDVSSSGGVFRGSIEGAGQGGEDLPLGEWEFSDLVLRATLARNELTVEEGHANTSGVEWEILGAQLPPAGSHGNLRVDFRARQVDDGPRSRALIGLMPRTKVDAGGWRNYRVTGTMNSPRVVGVD